MTDLKKRIESLDLVFLDLETTGLNFVEEDAICEIGAYKVRERQTIDEFHSLVNPRKKVPQQAYNIHKISDAELAQAPYFEQVMDSLVSFLNGSVVCAYNVQFDMGFINYEVKKLGGVELDLFAVDVLTMARRTLKLGKYNLGSIIQFFGIVVEDEFHRALSDAYAVREVFFRLSDILKEKEVVSMGDFLSLYGFENEVFRKQENQKMSVIQEAQESKKKLKIRYLDDEMRMREAYLNSVNLRQDKNIYYLWCHAVEGKSQRIRLRDILEIELA
ncbi:MAG: 3'-5' exonuclease [Candidatus Omnitrophota bacterium]|nr:3'-5' exonuclease [Candidatus Omnitrophota bacterium]